MSEMVVGKTTYEILAEADQSDLSYEWHTAVLLRDSEGNLFYLSGSGCSCDYFGCYVDERDLVSVKSAAEAVELAKEEFSSEDVFDFAQQAVKH